MIWLILFLIADFAVLAHYEDNHNYKTKVYTCDMSQMIKDAKHHAAHPEPKRSARWAEYYGT